MLTEIEKLIIITAMLWSFVVVWVCFVHLPEREREGERERERAFIFKLLERGICYLVIPVAFQFSLFLCRVRQKLVKLHQIQVNTHRWRQFVHCHVHVLIVTRALLIILNYAMFIKKKIKHSMFFSNMTMPCVCVYASKTVKFLTDTHAHTHTHTHTQIYI